jgi:hypothetical protein
MLQKDHVPFRLVTSFSFAVCQNKNNKTNSVARVRESTIPTEQPAFVGDVSVLYLRPQYSLPLPPLSDGSQPGSREFLFFAEFASKRQAEH